MYRIVEHTGRGTVHESTLETIQAANNRLRMLHKYNPGKVFVIEAPVTRKPKFTVSPIPKFTVERIPA